MRLIEDMDVGVSSAELAERDRQELAARLRDAAHEWATTTRRAQGLPEQLVLELFNGSNAESAAPDQTPPPPWPPPPQSR